MPGNEPLRLNGARFQRDKTGMVTLTVPWEVHTLEDCDSFVPDDGISLSIVDRNAEETEVGTWKLILTYQGLIAQPTKDQQSGDAIEVEFDGNMAQDPIKSHPKFSKLKAKFGWDKLESGSFGFPEILPKNAGQVSAHTGGSNVKESDVYGTDSWLVAEGVFRATITVTSAPNDVFDHVGEAVAVPEYWRLLGIPAPRGRNWLKVMPKLVRKGNATRITFEYRLSGPKGINKDIYNFAQLGGGSGASSGLQTGTL